MASTPIKNILVIGATGNTGTPIVHALLSHPANYNVTALTRNASSANFPQAVKVIESDSSLSSLRMSFQNQDAIVSCAHASQIKTQIQWIDLAIEAGVRRFIPSEFGMDSAVQGAEKFLPLLGVKKFVVDHLRANEDKITWSTLITGMFFDWAMTISFPRSWDVPNRKATVYDDGEYKGEWTNTTRVGEAIAAILSPEHEEETRNQYVYINSFSVSQNAVLAELEKVTGVTFEVESDTTANLEAKARQALKEGDVANGIGGLIVAGAFGAAGLNGYSSSVEGGLWNERLGLGAESMEETVRKVVKV